MKLGSFDQSRYNAVARYYDEKEGYMVFPFAPEFKKVYTHNIRSTDTIDSLASKFYGDSRFQWAILIANDLPFPPKLVAGKPLLVPDFEEVMSYVE
jgi:hypothetical protein